MNETYRFDNFINSTHSRIVNLIKPNSRILDVGCASGYLANKLVNEKHCEVVGIELNDKLANKAKKYCTRVYISDVEYVELDEPEKYFDYIIFADILEHTKDPKSVILNLIKYLADYGVVLISLPNIANFRVRLNLMMGRFEYQNSGILDATHLKFYTQSTAKKLIKSCGLDITDIIPVGKIIYYTKIFKNLFAHQFLFICRKADNADNSYGVKR